MVSFQRSSISTLFFAELERKGRYRKIGLVVSYFGFDQPFENVQIDTLVSESTMPVHGDETSRPESFNDAKGLTFFFCGQMGRWGFHGAGSFQRNWP